MMHFDFRDLNIYGGLLLVGLGLGLLSWGLGIAVVGAALFYLGVWRLK